MTLGGIMKTSRLLLIAITSMLALTGCGANGGNNEDSGAGIIKEDTEIVIWTTYNDTYQTVINNAIEEFQRIER